MALAPVGAVVLALCLAAPVLAQEPPVVPDSGAMTPGQVQDLFDAMLVMQAQDALGLAENQFAQFLKALRQLQGGRRRHHVERMRLINELQRLTNPRLAPAGSNEDVIRERLKALQELEARAAAESRRAYDAIDQVLDVRQQARFRVFEEQIERRKLELIGRARQGNPNRPNANRPPSQRRPPGRF